MFEVDKKTAGTRYLSSFLQNENNNVSIVLNNKKKTCEKSGLHTSRYKLIVPDIENTGSLEGKF